MSTRDLTQDNSKRGLYLILNCSKANNTIHQLKAYNLVWSISGLTMAAVTLAILVALLLARGYRSPLQRLFLYLTVSTLLSLTNNSLNLVLHFDNFNSNVCTAIGYTDVCLFTTSLLLASGIGLYLLFITYYLAQGKPLPKVGKLKQGLFEMVYLLAVVAIPPGAMTKNVDKFGVAGPLCWIQAYSEDCSRIHQEFELQILVTFTAIMAINIAIFVLLKLISCLLACRQEHVRVQHVRMAKRASLLVTCLGISLIINITSLWCHHKRADMETPFPILLVVATLVPSSPVIIPIGFMLYLNSTKKFKTLQSAMRRLRKHFSLPRGSTELFLAHKEEGVSPRHPGCQEAPSTTVSREVGYTGAFTDVSKSHYGSIDKTRYSE